MKAIRVRLGDISIACKVCSKQMVFYTTSCVALSSKVELQDQFDESFDEGFLSRKLRLSMSVSVIGDGRRWDSRLLRMSCTSCDDCLAAFCQVLFGEYTFGVVGTEDENAFWQTQIECMLTKYGYADFELLFDISRNNNLFSRGLQIWNLDDYGMGECHQDEVLITGDEVSLAGIYSDLENYYPCDFSANFIFAEKGSFEWIEL